MDHSPLTDLRVKSLVAKRLKKLYADNKTTGLYLKTTSSETGSWIFRWRDKRTGKLRDMGLGSIKFVKLKEARDIATDLHRLVRNNIDPVEHRSLERQAALNTSDAETSFLDCVNGYLEDHYSEWKNQKHRQQWRNTLMNYAVPHIGSTPVGELEITHIAGVLEPIWETKTETATRLRGRIEAVLSWAHIKGYRTADNPARWRGNLDLVLPKPSKLRETKHYPALHWRLMPEFMRSLAEVGGMGARALEFAIYTAARSGEVRHAIWSEIDVEERNWVIPSHKMKARKVHVVPLSTQALSIVNSLKHEQNIPTIFRAPRGGVLSDMSLSSVTRRLEVQAVPHGFRSTFKEWARNNSNHNDEVSELALAHVSTDATRAAYARDTLLEQRRELMQEWSDFIYPK